MALFNRKSSRKKAEKTINRAGGQAFVQSPKMHLASLLLTSFAQNQFYRSADDTFTEACQLLTKVDPLFAAKATIFARKEFGMRSISHVLAAELAAYVSGQVWAKDFYEQVINRPDDMLEIVAYFRDKGGKGLPNAMKKGFAKAFDRFDSYQIAKYRGDAKSVKLVDLVNMIHPTPTPNNEQALKGLVNGTLRNTQTWEAKLSQAGQDAKNEAEKSRMKRKVWEDLLLSNKLGYFALIRNLRNIMEQAPKMIDVVCDQLQDPNRIKRSLVLPFRLITAYMQIDQKDRDGRKIAKALDNAINIACENVPSLENSLVVIDNSGSMASPVAKSNHIKCNQLGAAFAMILAKKSNADIMEFGTKARYINYRLKTSVMEFAMNFERNNKVGHGTNFHSIFEKANKAYDRIVIFSDMQGWIGYHSPEKTYTKYRNRYDAYPFVYSFDLRGYGTMQFAEHQVYQLAGFSEKVFDMMGAVEQNPQELIDRIEAIEL